MLAAFVRYHPGCSLCSQPPLLFQEGSLIPSLLDAVIEWSAILPVTYKPARWVGLNNDIDVLIVGAGPSGSIAATTLARMGHSVALIDKAVFPRHKTCASWINALAFTRFPYLQAQLDALVDCPFYGIRFYDESISKHGAYNERKPSGYLTLRSKFDHGLAETAVNAGATLYQGVRATRVVESKSGVHATLSNGVTIRAKFLFGADGSNSQIARWCGLRKSWRPDEYVLCANEDVPYASHAIERFYGCRVPLFVSLRFNG